MKQTLFYALFFLTASHAAFAQKPRADLYRCEGCEAISEQPHENLQPQTTIEAGEGEGLFLSGMVYQTDGKTPASDVVVYAYHTDHKGVYPKRGDEQGWASRHGFLRGWVKTNAEGMYQFHTIRPGVYPNRKEPAHIHMTVKEPGHPAYWIDAVVFTDDPLVSVAYKRRQQMRGGSGIITLSQDEEKNWIGVRDIILEPHPKKKR